MAKIKCLKVVSRSLCQRIAIYSIFLVLAIFNLFSTCAAIIRPTDAGSCPDGFCRHSGGCYLVVGLNVTWIDARSYCDVLGGILLSVGSQITQTAAEGVLMRSKGVVYPGKFWLDFTDLLNPKKWKIMSDIKSLVYENWSTEVSSMENETVAQNCVYMSDEHGYRWSPVHCSEKMNFVCYAPGSSTTLAQQSSYDNDNYDCDNNEDDHDTIHTPYISKDYDETDSGNTHDDNDDDDTDDDTDDDDFIKDGWGWGKTSRKPRYLK